MRPLVVASIASFVIAFSSLAFANGSHHSSSGGGGSSEGPCIRWEKIDSGAPRDAGSDASGADASHVVADAAPIDPDAAAASDASIDASTSDAGDDAGIDDDDAGASSASDSHVGEKCVEHAGLFSCGASATHSTNGGVTLFFFGVAIAFAAAARRRAGARG